jgi:hypothetical protein
VQVRVPRHGPTQGSNFFFFWGLQLSPNWFVGIWTQDLHHPMILKWA